MRKTSGLLVVVPFKNFCTRICRRSSALRAPAFRRGKNLRQAATVVSKGGKKLGKVENKHTFDQELVKTWQNAGKKADLRRQVFLF